MTHTAESTPTEVALSKLAACQLVAQEAADAIAAGDLEHAEERIDKAGTKLMGASLALTDALHGHGSVQSCPQCSPRLWRVLGR